MNRLELWSDAHSTNMIGIHIVWCTKFRRPVMKEGVDVIVKQSIAQTCADNDWKVIDVEVMPDHIHIFISATPILPIHLLVKNLKGISSKILREEFPILKSRLPNLWTRSYYCETIGCINDETIKKYIENQKNK